MAAIIRYGMVGGGMKALIGEVHRKALKFDNRVELVAGCFSSHADRNAEVGVEYGLDPARVYANYEEMAKAEAAREDGIDFVSVVTPNNTHYAVCKAFLEAGINVVCEKPLCFTVEQAEELEALSREKDLLFGVTYTYTGYVMSKVMREMIAEGKIGKVVSVNAEYAQDWLLGELATGNNTQTNIAVWRTDPASPARQLRGRHRHPHRKLRPLRHRPEDQAPYRHHQQVRQGAGPQRQHHRRVRKRRQRRYWCSQVAAGHYNGLAVRVYGDKGALESGAGRPRASALHAHGRRHAAARPRHRLHPGKRPPRRAACPPATPRGWSRPLPTFTATMSPALVAKKNGADAEVYDYPRVEDRRERRALCQGRGGEASANGSNWVEV